MVFAVTRRHVLKVGIAGAGLAALPVSRASALAPLKFTNVSSLPFTLHLVVDSGGWLKKEGLTGEYLVSNAGARSAQMLAAGQTHVVLGDSSHPQRLTEQGKPTVLLFSCDRKCSYANLLVRKELYDGGLTGLDKVADAAKKAGGKLKAGATAIGSGTWMYGNFILRSVPAGDGKTANDSVEWQGLGSIATQLAALKTGKIDMVSASPDVMFEADRQGTAKVIYDVTDDAAWNRLFKGPIGVVGAYALKTTVEGMKDEIQAYVNACYKATQWMKDAPSKEIAAVIKPHQDSMGITDETLLQTLDWYKRVWQWDLDYSRESFDNGLNVVQGIKAEKVFPYEQVVDLSFLAKAKKA